VFCEVIKKRKRMTDLKKIALYILPFITICGALYHISFWNTYNMNGLSLISISDIIKAAVYPIFGSICIIIYQAIMFNYIVPTFGKDKPYRKGISNLSLTILYFSLFIISLIIILIFKLNNVKCIFFYGFITYFFLSVYLSNNNYFKSIFDTENFRRFFIDILVAVPLICFLGGKYNSQLIYQNIQYKYIISSDIGKNNTLKTTSDTLKLVGIVENFLVFSPLDNSTLIFTNKSEIKNLVLTDKKRK